MNRVNFINDHIYPLKRLTSTPSIYFVSQTAHPVTLTAIVTVPESILTMSKDVLVSQDVHSDVLALIMYVRLRLLL